MFALTTALGQFAAEVDSVPAAAATVARTGIIDAVGVMLAARREPVVHSIRLALAAGSGAGDASVLLSPQRGSVTDAAMINATSAHAFAMDDVAAGCHPSAILMPALWAEAEAGGLSGADLLRAYVVGYEVLAALAAREPDPLHSKGWHPTGILGPVAVAAAVANLKRLSAMQAAHALAIAASMTGGLVVNFGTPTKAVHAGRVASAGVLAARLAAAGVTAAADALEGRLGLLRTVTPAGRVDTGSSWQPPAMFSIVSQGLSIKKYPVCYSAHRVVDAAIDIAAQAGFDAQQVERIVVEIGTTQAWMARHHAPRTPLEARYSVEFAVVSGLVARAAGFDQLDESFIHSPLVQRLMARTTIALREDRSADDPVFSGADRVVVHTVDGHVFDSGDVAFARGHAKLPLTESELACKFLQCAASADIAAGQDLFDMLRQMDRIADMRAVAALPGLA